MKLGLLAQANDSVKSKKIKPRNPYAGAARSRSGAGPMRDRRSSKGGTRNTMGEDLEEWEEDVSQVEPADEQSREPAHAQERLDSELERKREDAEGFDSDEKAK